MLNVIPKLAEAIEESQTWTTKTLGFNRKGWPDAFVNEGQDLRLLALLGVTWVKLARRGQLSSIPWQSTAE